MKKFKPQLITNDPIPEDAPFPRLVSVKRHGICCIIMAGHDKVLGRSLKPIKNIQFQERFKPLVDYCNDNNCMIQGEAHITGAISDDMVHFLNTIDLDNMSSKSKCDISTNCASGKFKLHFQDYFRLPEELKIYAFDFLCLGTQFDTENPTINFSELQVNYLDRTIKLSSIVFRNENLLRMIPQSLVENQEREDELYNRFLKNGHEGIVIRYDKPYKFGRSTAREHLIYKRVPTPTFDGKIIAINQATVVDPNAEKTTNELGRSVTSKKLADRIPIEQAKDFQVEMMLEGKNEAVNFGVAMKGFDHEARKEVWKNPNKYIGRMIEFECKAYNGIGKPKSATFIRWRDDKE